MCVICLPGIVAITAANVKQALQMCLFGVWTCRRRDIAADERLRWESEDAKIRRHCCVWVSGTASWEQREESEKAVREERERESQRAREKPVAAKRCPTEDAYLHALEDHNTHRSHLTKLAEKKRGEAPQQQASAKQSGEKHPGHPQMAEIGAPIRKTSSSILVAVRLVGGRTRRVFCSSRSGAGSSKGPTAPYGVCSGTVLASCSSRARGETKDDTHTQDHWISLSLSLAPAIFSSPRLVSPAAGFVLPYP